MRAGIKRNQEKLHERMLNTSSKKLRPAEVGDTVVIPIAQPDKVNSLGPRNMLGCITGKGGDSISSWYFARYTFCWLYEKPIRTVLHKSFSS